MSENHNIEAEQALLGALLIQNEVLDKVGPLTADQFYDPVHQRIWACAAGLIASGKLASAVMLVPYMKNDPGLQELGGTDYLARLSGAAVSVVAAPHYARLIVDLAARRWLGTALEGAQQRLADGNVDPQDAIADLDAELAEITAETSPKPLIHSWRSVMAASVQEADTGYQNEGLPKMPTGLAALDKIIGGLMAGRVYVLAGRPSMGKTAIASVIADNAAAAGGVLWASLEMEDSEIGHRMISRRMAMAGTRVTYNRIERGDMTADQFRTMLEITADYESQPIKTVDESCASLPKLEMAARQAEKQFDKMGKPLGLIVVDYLQLLSAPGLRPGYDEVTFLSGAMKRLARRHQVPVLLLSQLNRGVESREDKRPRMDDLRQSGKIEEDASIVMMAFRDAYYLERELKAAKNDADRADIEASLALCRDKLEIIVGKNRSGPIGTAHLYCDLPVNIVSDIPTPDQEGLF